jgi:hypothetical protein
VDPRGAKSYLNFNSASTVVAEEELDLRRAEKGRVVSTRACGTVCKLVNDVLRDDSLEASSNQHQDEQGDSRLRSVSDFDQMSYLVMSQLVCACVCVFFCVCVCVSVCVSLGQRG